MKGDFSNATFDPTKHYSSVRMQQGRVQLDSDWNQQMDIFAHRIQTETNDFIGGPGAPTGNPGYGITILNNAIKISQGRYYVNGLLCENETVNLDFLQQPDYPVVSFADAGVTHDGTYLAYLDAWQRGIMAVDDPSLLEPALSGVDTTTRVQNIAQVKLLYNPNNLQPQALLNTLTPISTGTLTPAVTTGATLQNQLYRVEVHQGGVDGSATFKWSRDNGAVAARIQAVDPNSNTITLYGTTFNQQQNPFAVGQWVEISDKQLDLRAQPGTLAQITAVNQNQVVVSVSGSSNLSSFGDGSTLRLWDISDNTGIPIIANTPISLENGLSIEFTSGQFNTGDYWLIPSRAANNTIEWPQNSGSFSALAPKGIYHSYAPLATLTATNTSTNPVWGSTIGGNRTFFDPLATIYSKYLVPVGTVFPYAGIVNSDADVPAGYILCDGRQLSATNILYQALYGVISNKYGGSGQNFNLPDLRSRLMLGAGHGNNLSQRSLGAEGGSENSVTLSHTHGYQDTVWSENPDGYNNSTNFPNGDYISTRGEIINRNGARQPGSRSGTDNDGNISFCYNTSTGDASNAVGNPTDTNMPPYLVLNFIIKY